VVLARATCIICSHTACIARPLQPDVLLDEPLAVRLEQLLDLDRVRDHRRDDAEELPRTLVIALGLEAQLDAEHARRPPVEEQRHADEAALLAAGPLAQRRLPARARDHDGPTGGEDLARQRPAGDIARPGRVARHPHGGHDLQRRLLAALEGHGAPQGVVRLLENLEYAMERGLEVGRVGQRLADLEQRRQLPDLAGRPPRTEIEVRAGRRVGFRDRDRHLFTPYCACQLAAQLLHP
jgi:hypothetical protein